MLEHAYWIALLPALSFPINLSKKFKEPIPAYLGLLLILAAWVWSLAIFVTTLHTPGVAYTQSWAWAPPMNVGFQVDHMTTMMLVIVTTVSTLVQLYSMGYMHGDPKFNRFYAYLGLFTAAMLGLVLSDDYLLLLISWELVGVSSYLLIGFWFEKPSAMRAAKKAFIVTRLADLGLLIGVIMLWNAFHSFRYTDIFAAMTASRPDLIWAAGAAAILLFVGAAGKSAQFPLHVWLPDAMEGPTPVSALIHAATMVAAGVYLVGRSFPLFEFGSLHTFHWGPLGLTPLGFVRWTGVITLFMAATIAVAQNDIKRVLAYSTVSQLGYMVMSIGLGGWVAGLFHLMTHAFFKALLFLGSGSVIHGTGTQDMREMGGLAKKMPQTYWTYMIGYLALAGLVPFAGFWSKDAILDGAKMLSGEGKWLYFALGSAGAFLTAFYMTRQMWMVFWGPANRNPSLHIHESPPTMTLPLWILAIPALLIGFAGMPSHNIFKDYLTGNPETAQAHRLLAQAPGGDEPLKVGGGELPAYLATADLNAPGVDPALRVIHRPEEESTSIAGLNPGVAWPSTIIVIVGIVLGGLVYYSATKRSTDIALAYAHTIGLDAPHGHGHDDHGHGHSGVVALDAAGFWHEPLRVFGGLYTFLENKWYIDEFYWATLVVPTIAISKICAWIDKWIVDMVVNSVGGLGIAVSQIAQLIDKWIVDGFVNACGWVTGKAGRGLRYAQTGRVQNYAVVIFLGALFLVAVGLWRFPR